MKDKRSKAVGDISISQTHDSITVDFFFSFFFLVACMKNVLDRACKTRCNSLLFMAATDHEIMIKANENKV